MTTATEQWKSKAARPVRNQIYLSLAALCAAIAFLGFAPTYWAPLMKGTLKVHPLVHIHAFVFFAWSLFIVLQVGLAATRRIASHRAMGLAGVSLATAMVIFGLLVAIHQMHAAAALGQGEAGRAFAIVPFGGITFFAIVFAASVANISRPEWHKRLMLVAAISILDAPVARWFIVFLAPPGSAGPPPVSVDMGPAAVTVLLLALAMLLDWRRNGRVHLSYVIGTSALVAWKLAQAPLSATAAWHAIAGALMSLTG